MSLFYYNKNQIALDFSITVRFYPKMHIVYLLLKRSLVIMWLCFMTPVNVHVLNGFTMAELSKPILFDNMKPLKDVFSSFLSLSQYKMWQNMDLTFLHTTIWLRHSIKIQTRFVFYVKNYEDRKDKLSVFLYIKCLILKVVWWLNIAVSTHFRKQ